VVERFMGNLQGWCSQILIENDPVVMNMIHLSGIPSTMTGSLCSCRCGVPVKSM